MAKDITADKVTDCAGQIVGPGFVDMRVQSGYPGAEHLETLDSLLQAAAAGWPVNRCAAAFNHTGDGLSRHD